MFCGVELGFEEEKVNEKIIISINRIVLLKTLLIGFLSFVIMGVLIFNFSTSIITFGLSMIFGSTIGLLGIYFILISKPLFKGSISSYSYEDDEDLEFQSMMKIE